MEDAPDGRFFFRGFLLGILQPHRKRGRGLRPLSFVAIEIRAKDKEKKMARCCKCGRVCDTTYASNSNYFCKACWKKRHSSEVDPLAALMINAFVHVGLPTAGIVAIFIVCHFVMGFVHEKFGLSKEMCGYIWLGVSTVLSSPLIIKALRGLWMTWCATHWILKIIFCVCCPPLIILLVIEWLIKRFRKH